MKLPALPALFRAELDRYWERLGDTADRVTDRRAIIEHVWACSPFVAHYCTHNAARFMELVDSRDLEYSYYEDEYAQRLQAELAAADTEAALLRILRQFRQREMVRIAWRDIAGMANLEETLADLSTLADTVIIETQQWLTRQLIAQWGEPRDAEGRLQQLIILAMGKLGAHELNFSSDIDLIFVYPHRGETVGGRTSISNHEFFLKLGQKFIRALSETTPDGIVFRVDMRLRPFGDSGPLVVNFDSLEGYLLTHAREWERYAMIKARSVSGDPSDRDTLAAMLKNFVYRRYLDFGAIQSIRDMKNLIVAEVKRKGLVDNVKLGSGGIREIEFIGQIFQLMRGGRTPMLQIRPILPILERLGWLGYLTVDTVSTLIGAYRFLRTTEHRLQQMQDRQTHNLPDDPLNRQRLALGMGYADWEDFADGLTQHRQYIADAFALLLEEKHKHGTENSQDTIKISYLWPRIEDTEQAMQVLTTLGFDDVTTAVVELKKLQAIAAARHISREAHERLNKLMPVLLNKILSTANPTQTLSRLVTLLETILQRSVYLALLLEHPAALAQLITLCSQSAWIATHIRSQPILLDELLNAQTLYAPPIPRQLQEQLLGQLQQVPPGDLEQQMNVIRHFKQAQVLRIAAADITGKLLVHLVSDHLTAVAEEILKAVLQLAWEHLQIRFGTPCCVDAGVTRQAGFAIIAYGKLGGYELGYGSDLDLVFLHDSRGEQQATDGTKSISNADFFTRLAQRIIHLITTLTPAGQAYEIDARLRPSGASGLMVSSLDAFREYQHNKAWTWEHQALVRARAIAGDPAVMAGFITVRSDILQQLRDENKLQQEIREMRERMRKELDKSQAGQFHLKQGRGGIVDIEFIVQYLVLHWASHFPELTTTTANRQVLNLACSYALLDDNVAQTLKAAYFAYRDRAHALALQEQPALVSDTEFQLERQQVSGIWRQLLGS